MSLTISTIENFAGFAAIRSTAMRPFCASTMSAEGSARLMARMRKRRFADCECIRLQAHSIRG